MANGAFGGGTGVAADPFLIEDGEDLIAAITHTDTTFYGKQNKNIDLSGYANFPQLTLGPLTFNYNGGGYYIDGLYMRPSTSGAGLVSNTGDKSVKFTDTHLRNVSIVSLYNYVGGFVGTCGYGISAKASFIRCSIVGDLSGAKGVGGFFGGNATDANGSYQRYTSIHLSDCYSSCSVSGDFGIGCAIGIAKTFGSSDGGIEIKRSYVSGSVTANDGGGGFIGALRQDRALVLENSYSLLDSIRRSNIKSLSANFGPFSGEVHANNQDDTFVDNYVLDSIQYVDLV